MNPKIAELLEANDNDLPAFAWPGGYPLVYVADEGDLLCPKCANEYSHQVRDYDTNWEDPDLYCDECSTRIESAYAEDDDIERAERRIETAERETWALANP